MRRYLLLTLLILAFCPLAEAKQVGFYCIIEGDSVEFSGDSAQTVEIFLPYSYQTSAEITVITEAKTYTIPSKKMRQPESRLTVKVDEKSTVEFVKLPKLDLYLLIGQSNMAGRGYLTEQYKDTISNAYLLNYNGNMTQAVSPLNLYSNIRKTVKIQGVNPGYGFSKAITAQVPNQIGLIVNARGGSSINSWLKGVEDGYFEKTIERVNQAKRWGTIKAILWHQGEADRKFPQPYQQKLKNMVADFRSALGDMSIPFVAGEIAHWAYPESATFNAMIQSIATFIPNSDWVSAEGLTPLIDEKDPHFNAQSMVIMGERYANKVAQMVKRR